MKYVKLILVGLVISTLLDVLLDLIVPDRVMNGIFVVVASVLVVGISLVGYGTLVQNGWGINFKQVNCPFCNSVMPRRRDPQIAARKAMGWLDMREVRL